MFTKKKEQKSFELQKFEKKAEILARTHILGWFYSDEMLVNFSSDSDGFEKWELNLRGVCEIKNQKLDTCPISKHRFTVNLETKIHESHLDIGIKFLGHAYPIKNNIEATCIIPNEIILQIISSFSEKKNMVIRLSGPARNDDLKDISYLIHSFDFSSIIRGFGEVSDDYSSSSVVLDGCKDA